MFEISTNQILKVTRGDSFSCPLFINRGSALHPIRCEVGVPYEYEGGHTVTVTGVYVAITPPNKPFECALVKKYFDADSTKTPKGDLIVYFQSEDTARLLPGKYYYQVKVRTVDENSIEGVNTIIQKTEFWVVD